MCSLIIVFLIFSGLWGFSSFQVPPDEGALPSVLDVELLSCEPASTEDDLAAIHEFVGDTFESADWTENIQTEDLKTVLFWLSGSLGAVANFEYLHYDCGYTPDQIATYFSKDNFDVIFADYQSYEFTDVCAAGDLTLYQFEAVLNDIDYHVLLWVHPVSSTRVADLMLIFPVTNSAQQAEYAARLFPELPSCAPAAA